jgi:hypothetical protein
VPYRGGRSSEVQLLPSSPVETVVFLFGKHPDQNKFFDILESNFYSLLTELYQAIERLNGIVK